MNYCGHSRSWKFPHCALHFNICVFLQLFPFFFVAIFVIRIVYDNCRYLSEAGASLVDSNLKLGVVPKTKVIKLSSPSFHYGRLKRYRADVAKSAAEHFPEIGRRLRQGLPLKTGSLQLFVRGYKVFGWVLTDPATIHCMAMNRPSLYVKLRWPMDAVLLLFQTV